MPDRESTISYQETQQGGDDGSATARAPRMSFLGERTSDPKWLLVDEGFTLAREHEVESLFAIANGYIGNRGSLAEGSPLSAPATFAAGVFEAGKEGSVPGLFVLPDWTGIGAWIEEQPLSMQEGENLEHRRLLDLRSGVFWREWRHRDARGRRTRIVALRFASLADRHLLAQSVWLTPENYNATVVLEGKIELAPEIVSFTASGEWRTRRDASRPNVLPLALRAPGRDTVVAFAAASRMSSSEPESGRREISLTERHMVERFTVDVKIGAEYRLDRLVSIYTSRDLEDPVEAAVEHMHRVMPGGVAMALAAHRSEWERRWRNAEVAVEGDEELQRALRFAEYHLISCANPEDERVSIGARALSGESYKGHVFWDTEIYMVPFYAMTDPASARALLMYRYHLLPAAREKARKAGYRGAMYPWESADTGDETTPRYVIGPTGEVIGVLNGELEIHITADIAYAFWHYWKVTGDDSFLLDGGAEVIFETARFWASRGRWEEDDRYHIRHVIGPDEYHEDVDDNAYTNIIAAWNLRRGLELKETLESEWPERWAELRGRLQLKADEFGDWQRIADGMFTGFDPKTLLYEQFEGYYQKEPVDLLSYEPRTAAMDVILGHEGIQKTNVVKQADVLMAIALLWDDFPPEVREANFRYYEPRTGHGSSLSPAMHAYLAGRLGDMEKAEKYLRQAAAIDLGNNMGNAAGGVHAAAIGGLWQAVILGFAGVRPYGEVLRIEPRMPPGWQRLRFPLQWRGRRLEVQIDRETVVVRLEEGAEEAVVSIGEGGEEVRVGPGQEHAATLARSA